MKKSGRIYIWVVSHADNSSVLILAFIDAQDIQLFLREETVDIHNTDDTDDKDEADSTDNIDDTDDTEDTEQAGIGWNRPEYSGIGWYRLEYD